MNTIKYTQNTFFVFFLFLFVCSIYSEDKTRIVLQFPALKVNEKITFVEQDDEITYYRNIINPSQELYRAFHVVRGPEKFTFTNQFSFFICEDGEVPGMNYGLYFVDGKNGRITRILDVSGAFNISKNGLYTAYHDNNYLLNRISEGVNFQDRICIYLNSESRIYSVIDVSGILVEYEPGVTFNWDRNNSGFSFVIMRSDYYRETYHYDLAQNKQVLLKTSNKPEPGI